MNKKRIYIYQVLPRLFGNINRTCHYNGDLSVNGVGKFTDFTTKALDEIQGMGFTHIWYTGVIEHATETDYTAWGIHKDNPEVVKGKAGSPYAIKDYYDVSPDLAIDVDQRIQEFEQLIVRTHEAGLKVIMDFVPNHVARQYCSDKSPEGIVPLGDKDNKEVTFAPNNNFYYLPNQKLDISSIAGSDFTYDENPAKATGNNNFSNKPSVNDWYETIKLNYGIDYAYGHTRCHFSPMPDTWTKMTDILLYWAAKGIDGFRCDMVEMVPVEFWAWAIPQVKSKYPDTLFIAEVYDPAQYHKYVEVGKFDYLYDKVDLYDTLCDVIKGTRATSDITLAWQHVNHVRQNLLYFLENHDEVRLASDFLATNPWKAIPALQLICWINANPVMIYFGQELGERGMDEEGFSGKDGRTTIFDYWSLNKIARWNNGGQFGTALLTDDEISLRNKYIEIIRLSEVNDCLNQGEFYDLMYANYNNCQFNSARKFVFLKYYQGNFALIVNNFSEADADAEVEIPQEAYEHMNIQPDDITKAFNLLSGEDVEVPRTNVKIKIHVKALDSSIIYYIGKI